MSVAAYLGIASGLLLALTGAGLAVARPKRVGGWFFTGFVVLWGAEIVLFNSLEFPDSLVTVLRLERIALALIVVETLFLIHFMIRFTRTVSGPHRWWSLAALAYAAVMGTVLAVWPQAFSDPAGLTTLSAVGIILPNFAALYITLGILGNRYFVAQTAIEARELFVVFVGLSLYASYTAGFYLALDLSHVLVNGLSGPSQALFMALFMAASAWLLWLARSLAGREPVPARPGWRSRRRTLIYALTVPLLLGLVTGPLDVTPLPRIDLLGLFRIGTALLIAYGLLKFQLFDIDLRIKRGLSRSTLVALFLVIFFVVSEGIESLVSEQAGTVAGLVAAGGLAVAFRPLERSARTLADRVMPAVDESEAYLAKRRLEVYEAAVERAVRDLVLDDRERGVLSRLATDLGIRSTDAEAIQARILAAAPGAIAQG